MEPLQRDDFAASMDDERALRLEIEVRVRPLLCFEWELPTCLPVQEPFHRVLAYALLSYHGLTWTSTSHGSVKDRRDAVLSLTALWLAAAIKEAEKRTAISVPRPERPADVLAAEDGVHLPDLLLQVHYDLRGKRTWLRERLTGPKPLWLTRMCRKRLEVDAAGTDNDGGGQDGGPPGALDELPSDILHYLGKFLPVGAAVKCGAAT